MSELKINEDLLQLRQYSKIFLLENPNYFGTLVGYEAEKFKPQLKKVADTYFEEITCLSFNPQTEELSAIVQLKQSSGYNGGPCTNGSKEYIRFWVDYQDDNVWVDIGMVNFDVHDLPFGKEKLCYAVKLPFTPQKRYCCNDEPILPKVRAILSWNDPPSDQPHQLPVWGNRLESHIQIAPQSDKSIFCKLKKSFLDLNIQIDPLKLEAFTSAFSKVVLPDEEVPSLPKMPVLALKHDYGAEVEGSRWGYKLAYALAKEPTNDALFEQIKVLKEANLNISEVVKFLQESKFNTAYEELKCVGFNHELSVLHASVVIKRPNGYAGGLCHKGSLEYVAFYMDFGDSWQYMGTSSVQVHDLKKIPSTGLWYHVTLPVSLSKYQKPWCQSGKAKVRAILSWNVPPTPYEPNYVAHWGDWEECHIEIKPLPKGASIGEQIFPIIQSVGGMPIELINAAGYANGENSSGLTAIDSPFDGNILIRGIIVNAPDSSTPGVSRVKYRIMVKPSSHTDFQPWLSKFDIHITKVIGGVVYFQQVSQQPDPEGWIEYYPDFVPPDITSEEQNLLGVFRPAEKGLHEVYIEIRDTSNNLVKSNKVKFMVDKDAPEVDIDITSGNGNCGTFVKDDLIKGTFSIKDKHCGSVKLYVTPSSEAGGANPKIDGTNTSQLDYSPSGTLPENGLSGNWTLNTNSMKVCGYNIAIRGTDRTIVNSSYIRTSIWKSKGFCLKAK